MKNNIRNFILFLAIFFLPLIGEGKQRLKLNPQLKESYLTLLNQAVDFHKVIAEGDQKALQAKVQEIQEIVAKLYRQIGFLPKFHHRIHSHKLLNSIEEQLSRVRVNDDSSVKSAKRENIKNLFNSFFELAQVYNLTKDMEGRIFYCSQDKSLWFQKNSKAENPINSSYKNCGRLVL